MREKIKEYLYLQKVFFPFYFKTRVISIRTIICILLSLIPLSYTLISIDAIIRSHIIVNQIILDNEIFWWGFIGATFFSPYFLMIPLIIAADIVSGEFSNRTAMVLYSTVSRNKVLLSKIMFLLVYLLIFLLIPLISFGIMSLILFNLTVSMNILINGFFLVLVSSIFILSLTFTFSALTRSSIISFLIPFLYFSFEPVFELFNVEFLSYSYFRKNIYLFLQNIFFNESFIVNDLVLSYIVFFGAPIIVFIITFYGFKRLDIRTN